MSLIANFALFTVGFFMRPIGAMVFGYFGDRYGRKKILAAGIILMAVATALVGCLPTYAHLGVLASVLLILCRLLQGLYVYRFRCVDRSAGFTFVELCRCRWRLNPFISEIPFIILAENSNKIRRLRAEAIAHNMSFNDFTDTMNGGGYQEQLAC